VDVFFIILICLNVLAIILESVASLEAQYHNTFQLFELISVAIFTLEYLARVWASVDQSRFSNAPLKGRLQYMFTPMALIDLLAILPFYLGSLVGLDLRFLRFLRVLRIFKLTRYSAAMRMVINVFKEEAGTFCAAFSVLLMLMVLASSGIYLIEHEVQPEAFGSIPASMWWAISTLTTVGYGDVTPITPWGKFFGSCITLVGMGMVALPAGILASGFSEQMARQKSHYRMQLDDAMEDGEISAKEAKRLQHLQEELGLSSADTQLLYQASKRALRESLTQCPHCQKSLHKDQAL